MNELILPCLSYAVLMTFTPGPNNVSSSALGLSVGYRKSLPYLFGITTGFIVIMLCGGLLTEFLTQELRRDIPLDEMGRRPLHGLARDIPLPLHSREKTERARPPSGTATSQASSSNS